MSIELSTWHSLKSAATVKTMELLVRMVLSSLVKMWELFESHGPLVPLMSLVQVYMGVLFNLEPKIYIYTDNKDIINNFIHQI